MNMYYLGLLAVGLLDQEQPECIGTKLYENCTLEYALFLHTKSIYDLAVEYRDRYEVTLLAKLEDSKVKVFYKYVNTHTIEYMIKNMQ